MLVVQEEGSGKHQSQTGSSSVKTECLYKSVSVLNLFNTSLYISVWTFL